MSRLFYDTLVGLGKQGRPPGRCGLVGTIHKAERADGPPPLPWPLCASSHIPWNERSPHLGSRLPSRNSPIRNRRRLCPTVRRRLSGWKGWNYPIRKRPTDLKSAKPTGTHPLPRRLRSRPRDQRVRQDDRVANTPARTIIKNLVSGAAPAPEPWERVAHGGSSGNRSGPSHVPQGVFRRLAGLSAVDPCNPPVTLVDLVAVVGDARLDQEPIRRRRVVLSYDLVGRVGIRAAAHAM